MSLSTVHVCPVCNKEFDTHGYRSYLYKKVINGKTHTYCSWTCMHKAEQDSKSKKYRRSMNGY